MISAILLAAGHSQRMGGDNKLIKKYNKKHLINHILDTLIKSKIKKIIVVSGFQYLKIKKLILFITRIINLAWQVQLKLV